MIIHVPNVSTSRLQSTPLNIISALLNDAVESVEVPPPPPPPWCLPRPHARTPPNSCSVRVLVSLILCGVSVTCSDPPALCQPSYIAVTCCYRWVGNKSSSSQSLSTLDCRYGLQFEVEHCVVGSNTTSPLVSLCTAWVPSHEWTGAWLRKTVRLLYVDVAGSDVV